VVEGSNARNLLDRFSRAFYDKSARGRLWGPVWRTIDLRGKSVLDYGCGDGHFTHLLARLGAHAYGIDISPQLIAKAEGMAPQQANGFPRFLVGDAHATPFQDDAFDYVMGNGALHHFVLEHAYAEIARVLKPGGKAFFQEPMAHHPLLRLLRRGTPALRTDDERPLSLEDLDRARKYFRACRCREHFLFAVGAAPAHLLGKNAALAVINAIDRFDQMVMRALPPLRRFAWLTVAEWEK
jgi:SAM-dependent methyltransferase